MGADAEDDGYDDDDSYDDDDDYDDFDEGTAASQDPDDPASDPDAVDEATGAASDQGDQAGGTISGDIIEAGFEPNYDPSGFPEAPAQTGIEIGTGPAPGPDDTAGDTLEDSFSEGSNGLLGFVKDKIDAAKANPIGTLVDIGVGFSPVGPINTFSGLLGGPTVGGALTGQYGAPGAPYEGELEFGPGYGGPDLQTDIPNSPDGAGRGGDGGDAGTPSGTRVSASGSQQPAASVAASNKFQGLLRAGSTDYIRAKTGDQPEGLLTPVQKFGSLGAKGRYDYDQETGEYRFIPA